MRWALGFVMATAACSFSDVADDFVSPDASDIDATVSFGFDGGPIFSDGSAIDAALEPDATKFNGGGPFMCSSCVCDGTLDLCFLAGGGAPSHMPLDDGGGLDASACAVDDASSGPCRQIPVACLPKPTCACIASFYPEVCNCTITADGSGFMVECVYP